MIVKKLLPVVLVFILALFYTVCDNCSGGFEERIEIKSVAVIDTILSNRLSYGNCSSDKCTSYEIPFQNGYKDTISLSVVVLGDTLDYVVGGKDLNNTYIVIDSVETPCDSSYSIISKRGSGHYRVDSKRLYSCVFYFEPSCP
ncbi:hypothetical protein [Fibrobacter sp.]|uniref:hypothetical protein n=1 Tax=Fibrobacter sp. TaxID=35828 RepID=UPI0026085095|nr:hypothetical protein [Fibrobacter sp.]MDD5943658.1 hypothetical protein [Fibrobacter sp.]